MCAGAIINARIPRVYYGARDREMGACGGVMNLFMEDFPHPPALVGGILGILIMLALAYLGNTELLTPLNILAYQLIWMVPGLLVTFWPRTI